MRGRLRSGSSVNDAGDVKSSDNAGSAVFKGGDEIPAYAGKHHLRLSQMIAFSCVYTALIVS